MIDPFYRHRPNRYAHLGLAALLVSIFLVLAACGGGDSQASEPDEEADAAEEAVPVEVATLGRGPIEEVLRFSTNLEAEAKVAVHSQAARQVRQLLAEEGDRVRKGQVLLRLQDDEQRNDLAKIKAEIAKARREYQRQSRLWDEKLISEQAFNDATYELEQLELSLEEVERQLAYTVVRAPISGAVTRRLANLGDQVTINQHLFDIVDFGSIVARVYVPERDLPRVRTGQPARIAAPALGDERYAGRVLRLAPVVDPQSGTVKVTIALPERPELRPGLYVDVELVTEVHEQAVLLPKRALVYDQDQTFVYRLGEGDTVERVRVRPVLENATHVEPDDRLAAGDRIVVAGQAGLKDGAVVRPLEVDPATVPAPTAAASAAAAAEEAAP